MSGFPVSFLPELDHEVVVYHNPRCSKSRGVLAYLEEVAPDRKVEVIRYLDTPPTADQLKELIAAMGIPVIEAVRTKEPDFKELGLSKYSSDEELIEAMVAHPRLIERPIVVTDKGVRIARPTDAVEEIL